MIANSLLKLKLNKYHILLSLSSRFQFVQVGESLVKLILKLSNPTTGGEGIYFLKMTFSKLVLFTVNRPEFAPRFLAVHSAFERPKAIPNLPAAIRRYS